jgi:pimeloyl-ACP methyl ester carboxylesterase
VRIALAALLAVLSALAAAADVGVVLLHGKGGVPSGYVAELASALKTRGFAVSTPLMPWAKDRIYDASFESAIAQIDGEVEALRRQGARLVAVAGQSLGANAALGYAASRERVDAVIMLAPAHNPESQVFARRVGADVQRAKDLVQAGKGKDLQSFSDLNQGRTLQVRASAEVYLSWMDPAGPAVMPKSAASIKSPVPLLFVVGSADTTAPTKSQIFDKAPPHPKSRFVTLSADHFTLPSAATEEVAGWLAGLGAQ